jgi:predicted chitinase
MRAAEFITEIDRRGFLKGAAATAAAGSVAAPFVYNKLKGSEHPELAPIPQQPAPKLGLVLKSPAEKYLHDYAISKGINGIELAALMAQCSHESQGFTKFVENGVVSYFRKYDIRYNRDNALGIGNSKPGDGYLYRGRGYIHLTGRDNYRIFGKKIGQPLEEQPELAADPTLAAQIAVEYWKSRVQGRVTDFTDIKAVTKPINKNLEGLIDRTRRFKEYMKGLG